MILNMRNNLKMELRSSKLTLLLRVSSPGVGECFTLLGVLSARGSSFAGSPRDPLHEVADGLFSRFFVVLGLEDFVTCNEELVLFNLSSQDVYMNMRI